jgi:hypothetical protein
VNGAAGGVSLNNGVSATARSRCRRKEKKAEVSVSLKREAKVAVSLNSGAERISNGGGRGVAENEDWSEYRAELCTAGMELDPNGSPTPPVATQHARRHRPQ